MHLIIETLGRFLRLKRFVVKCAYCGRTKHDLRKYEAHRTICCYPAGIHRAVVD